MAASSEPEVDRKKPMPALIYLDYDEVLWTVGHNGNEYNPDSALEREKLRMEVKLYP
jgi:hypothetical protein